MLSSTLIHRSSPSSGLVGPSTVCQAYSSREGAEHRKRGNFEEAVGNLAAQLWVGRAEAGAHAWIEQWSADVAQSQYYLRPVVSALRAALFVRFKPNATVEDGMIQDRARDVLQAVVASRVARSSR